MVGAVVVLVSIISITAPALVAAQCWQGLLLLPQEQHTLLLLVWAAQQAAADPWVLPQVLLLRKLILPQALRLLVDTTAVMVGYLVLMV